MSENDFNAMFGITRGVYFALQIMAQKVADNGRIVSISTGGTSMAMAGAGAYAGNKAAIEQFSNALATEIGRSGVTVNTLAPGVIDTDGMALNDEQKNGSIAQMPLGRLGKPGDIAAAVALLVSPDAHWITGQYIRATDGIVCRKIIEINNPPRNNQIRRRRAGSRHRDLAPNAQTRQPAILFRPRLRNPKENQQYL